MAHPGPNSIGIGIDEGGSTPIYDFTQPQSLCDVVLIVDGVRLYVHKTFLALHSAYFHTLFFSDFSEQSKEEVALEEVEVDEFVELLHVIYPSRKPVTEANVESLLELADKFQFQTVLNDCEKLLVEQAAGTTMARKFLLAERCSLPRLKAWCMGKLRSSDDVRALERTEEYIQLSAKTKVAVLEKFVEHNNQGVCYSCNSYSSISMHELMRMEVYGELSDNVKLVLLKKALRFC